MDTRDTIFKYKPEIVMPMTTLSEDARMRQRMQQTMPNVAAALDASFQWVREQRAGIAEQKAHLQAMDEEAKRRKELGVFGAALEDMRKFKAEQQQQPRTAGGVEMPSAVLAQNTVIGDRRLSLFQ